MKLYDLASLSLVFILSGCLGNKNTPDSQNPNSGLIETKTLEGKALLVDQSIEEVCFEDDLNLSCDSGDIMGTHNDGFYSIDIPPELEDHGIIVVKVRANSDETINQYSHWAVSAHFPDIISPLTTFALLTSISNPGLSDAAVQRIFAKEGGIASNSFDLMIDYISDNTNVGFKTPELATLVDHCFMIAETYYNDLQYKNDSYRRLLFLRLAEQFKLELKYITQYLIKIQAGSLTYSEIQRFLDARNVESDNKPCDFEMATPSERNIENFKAIEYLPLDFKPVTELRSLYEVGLFSHRNAFEFLQVGDDGEFTMFERFIVNNALGQPVVTDYQIQSSNDFISNESPISIITESTGAIDAFQFNGYEVHYYWDGTDKIEPVADYYLDGMKVGSKRQLFKFELEELDLEKLSISDYLLLKDYVDDRFYDSNLVYKKNHDLVNVYFSQGDKAYLTTSYDTDIQYSYFSKDSTITELLHREYESTINDVYGNLDELLIDNPILSNTNAIFYAVQLNPVDGNLVSGTASFYPHMWGQGNSVDQEVLFTVNWERKIDRGHDAIVFDREVMIANQTPFFAIYDLEEVGIYTEEVELASKRPSTYLQLNASAVKTLLDIQLGNL